MLHVGQTYNAGSKAFEYAKKASDTYELEDSDSLNYFIQTEYPQIHKSYRTQSGIFKGAKDECIITSSTIRSRSDEYNPWEDEFNEDVGYIHYYGDNKRSNVDPASCRGNKYLLKQFKISHSADPSVRAKAIPILFFETPKGGQRTFHGYGTVESAKLVTQYNTKGKNREYFANYLFTFCVFSLKREQESFNWDWIAARRDHDKYAASLAPKEWQTWIKTGDFNKVRRRVYGRSTTESKKQLPTPGSQLDQTLNKIHDFYSSNPWGFEYLAKDVTRLAIEDSGTHCHDGWVTKASGDGGYDFVLRIDIGTKGLGQVREVVLGQAKCYARHNGITGEAVDRVVARLKRGWIAAFVTTSYFSIPTQKEILEDNYPIMLINGLKLAQIVNKYIYEKNISLTEYLNGLKQEQSYKMPEDILKEE